MCFFCLCRCRSFASCQRRATTHSEGRSLYSRDWRYSRLSNRQILSGIGWLIRRRLRKGRERQARCSAMPRGEAQQGSTSATRKRLRGDKARPSHAERCCSAAVLCCRGPRTVLYAHFLERALALHRGQDLTESITTHVRHIRPSRHPHPHPGQRAVSPFLALPPPTSHCPVPNNTIRSIGTPWPIAPTNNPPPPASKLIRESV